jgi:hypothetical protein
MRIAHAALLAVLIWCAIGQAAGSAPPTDFAGVAIGSTLAQVRAIYPEAKRNPDSDSHYQVWMVPSLKTIGAPSPAAFCFFDGRLVGGEVLMSNSIARLWLENTTARFGEPDSCTYCDYPDMASARWNWTNGTTIAFAGSWKLSEFTREGQTQRNAWLNRGEQPETLAEADSDDAASVVHGAPHAPSPKKQAASKKHPSTEAKPAPPATRWQKLYALVRTRLHGLFGMR